MRSILLWMARNQWLRERLPKLWFARRAVRRFMPGEDADSALAAAAGFAADDAAARTSESAAERRRLRLRMQGVIDQMQAGVARIDEMGVTLREIETGLVDFPALVAGR